MALLNVAPPFCPSAPARPGKTGVFVYNSYAHNHSVYVFQLEVICIILYIFRSAILKQINEGKCQECVLP